MNSFKNLEAWKSGLALLKGVHELTKKFPKAEKYSLVSQLRRASISILANIAEGFSRTSPADKAHKYTICRGECSEVEALLIVSKELGYVTDSDINPLLPLTDRTGRLLSGLIHAHTS